MCSTTAKVLPYNTPHLRKLFFKRLSYFYGALMACTLISQSPLWAFISFIKQYFQNVISRLDLAMNANRLACKNSIGSQWSARLMKIYEHKCRFLSPHVRQHFVELNLMKFYGCRTERSEKWIVGLESDLKFKYVAHTGLVCEQDWFVWES